MNKLIIMSGIPGCGKTTLARQLQTHYQETFNKRVAIISSDDVRADVAGTAQNHDHEKEVWQEFETRIKTASLIHDIVIADSTAVTNNLRLQWFNRFKGFFDRIELNWFNIPFSICWERNLQRAIPVPLDVMANLYRMYQDPSYEAKNIFDAIMEIKG